MPRSILLLCALAAAFPVRAAGVGAEIGGGLGYATSSGYDSAAPALSARVAYGTDTYGFALRGLLLIGGEASYQAGGAPGNPSGLRAWAALAEVSGQTDGPVSLGLRFGAGLGKVIGLNCNCEEVAPLHGHVAPAFLGSIVVAPRLSDAYRIALELALIHFADLEHGGAPFSQPASGLDAWTGTILLSFQWLQR
jgi:hypothetical protein